VSLRKKISLARELVLRNPDLSKTAVARQFGIGRSTLYVQSARQIAKDKALLANVLSTIRDHPHYGHRRLGLALGRSKNTILRIMRKYGLKVKRRRKRPNYRANKGGNGVQIPNRIKRLSPACPDGIWAGDFTYLSYHGFFLYLATVLDLYTREVVGWALGFHHSADLVITALEDAKRKRGTTAHTFHSDQGSEYDSIACRAWLLAHRVLPSQSAKAHPWENGRQEAFFRTFKDELGNVNEFLSLEDLIEAIHHQIHYYNTERIHGVLKMTPAACYRHAMTTMPGETFDIKNATISLSTTV
jgi:putative transposase